MARLNRGCIPRRPTVPRMMCQGTHIMARSGRAHCCPAWSRAVIPALRYSCPCNTHDGCTATALTSHTPCSSGYFQYQGHMRTRCLSGGTLCNSTSLWSHHQGSQTVPNYLQAPRNVQAQGIHATTTHNAIKVPSIPQLHTPPDFTASGNRCST